MRKWEQLPHHVAAFGLFAEPLGWRQWQAQLDRMSLPNLPRSVYPRHRTVRVAAAAVLLAHDDGSFEVSWHGILLYRVLVNPFLGLSCWRLLALFPLPISRSSSLIRSLCGESPIGSWVN